MKVLFILQPTSHASPLKPMGGGNSMAIDLAEALQLLGCEVTVAGAVGESINFEHKGVVYWSIGAGGVVMELPRLAKQNFDVVYAHRCWILYRVRKWFPRAVLLLGLIDNFISSHRLSIKSINATANAILPVSNYLLQQGLMAGMRKHKLIRYKDGLHKELFRPDQDKQREENLIVFAGATIQEKGLPLLVIAMNNLVKKFPDLRLEIFGSSSLWGRQNHVDWSRLEKSYPYIRYRGSISRSELANIYQRATLCVIPSIPALIQEGFTRVSMEAQACGCPVVVSSSGGLPETLIDGETGIVVHHLNSVNLVTAIEQLLLNKPLLQQMSQSAAKYAAQFDRNITAQQLLDVVEYMKNGKNRHGVR